jgi:hypothetical protein
VDQTGPDEHERDRVSRSDPAGEGPEHLSAGQRCERGIPASAPELREGAGAKRLKHERAGVQAEGAVGKGKEVEGTKVQDKDGADHAGPAAHERGGDAWGHERDEQQADQEIAGWGKPIGMGGAA